MSIVLLVIGGCLLLVQQSLGAVVAVLDWKYRFGYQYAPPEIVYACDAGDGLCSRQDTIAALNASDAQPYQSIPYQGNALQLCAMMCGPYRTLWPQPSVITELGNQFVLIDLAKLRFEYVSNLPADTNSFLDDISEIFLQSVLADRIDCPACIVPKMSGGGRVTIRFDLLHPATTTLHWFTDESYTLDVLTVNDGTNDAIAIDDLIVNADVRVQLNATTVFGLRHGLTTLAQLMQHSVHDVASTTVILNRVKISDAPVFPHRGLLLDTARNPLGIADLERTIRTMAATKMNVLHWHATDAQSFSLDVPSVPEMARYGSYSAATRFDATTVRSLVAYALRHGVRVLLEIDSPSDAYNGWQWGHANGLGNLSVCGDWQPWRRFCARPPCGHLNPANANVMEVLRKIYADVKRMLAKDERVLHMGGEQVHFGCWNGSAEVLQYMSDRGMNREPADFRQLWSEFLDGAHNTWTDVVNEVEGAAAVGIAGVSDKASPKIILWSSHLTDPETVEKRTPRDRYVVQTSAPHTDAIPAKLLELDYQMIMSPKNAWYFDQSSETSNNTWSKAYDNRIPHKRGVLGGEACVWSDFIDARTLDGRVWPRAAAVAERLWSNPLSNARQAVVRMYRLRERLVRGGVVATAVAPVWCVQHEGECM